MTTHPREIDMRKVEWLCVVLSKERALAPSRSVFKSYVVTETRRSPCETPRAQLQNLEHLECSRQPHIQGRGAQKRTQRAG